MKCTSCNGTGEDFHEGDLCYDCGGSGDIDRPGPMAGKSVALEYVRQKIAKKMAELDKAFPRTRGKQNEI